LGTAIGTAVGVALGQLAMGVALGVGLGVVFEARAFRRRSPPAGPDAGDGDSDTGGANEK
tara:strand:+ start:1583 stop:1762 length:180 start_codon:yes stop_codon:yes gene_type:complete